MSKLDNQIALVTGAARGIGQAIALRLAQDGADLALCDVKAEWLDETAQKVRALGRRAEIFPMDVSDAAAVPAAVDAVIAAYGRIDILVNNAGITRDNLVMRMSEEQWDTVIDVNLKSAFNFIHAVVPVMSRGGGGSIINMSSVAGQMGNAGQVNYSASKAGLVAMAKSVAREMGSRGIRANAIAPGFVISAMTDALPEKVREDYIGRIPMHRGGTPDEIASVALFLGSDLSSYVSGQLIAVNGALYT